MSRQIIAQPNGLFAVWSSVVDTFVLIDATPEEIIDEWAEEERARIAKNVNRVVNQLRDHKARPYYQFTMRWEEALAKHQSVHGIPFNPQEVAGTGEVV